MNLAATVTPLYCPCGNRLGLRRSDGAFVSRQKGRTVEIYPVRSVEFNALHTATATPAKVTCESCQLTTEVDSLLDKTQQQALA